MKRFLTVLLSLGLAAGQQNVDLNYVKGLYNGNGILVHMLGIADMDAIITDINNGGLLDMTHVADCGPQCSAWSYLQQQLPALAYNYPDDGQPRVGLVLDIGAMDDQGAPISALGQRVQGMATQDFDTWNRQRCASSMGPSFENTPLPWGRPSWSEDLPPAGGEDPSKCLVKAQRDQRNDLDATGDVAALSKDAFDTGKWVDTNGYVGTCGGDSACENTASGGTMNQDAIPYQAQCTGEGDPFVDDPAGFEDFRRCFNLGNDASAQMAKEVRDNSIPSWTDPVNDPNTFMDENYELVNVDFGLAGIGEGCTACEVAYMCYLSDGEDDEMAQKQPDRFSYFREQDGIFVSYLGTEGSKWKDRFAWFQPDNKNRDFTAAGMFACRWFKQDFAKWRATMKDNYVTMWNQAYDDYNDGSDYYGRVLSAVPGGGAYLQNEVDLYVDQGFTWDWGCTTSDQFCFKGEGCLQDGCKADSQILRNSVVGLFLDEESCVQKLAFLDQQGMTASGGKLDGWRILDGTMFTSAQQRCNEYGSGDPGQQELQIEAARAKALQLATLLGVNVFGANFLSNVAVHPAFTKGSTDEFMYDLATTASSQPKSALGSLESAPGALESRTGSPRNGQFLNYSYQILQNGRRYQSRYFTRCRSVNLMCTEICRDGLGLPTRGWDLGSCVDGCVAHFVAVDAVLKATCRPPALATVASASASAAKLATAGLAEAGAPPVAADLPEESSMLQVRARSAAGALKDGASSADASAGAVAGAVAVAGAAAASGLAMGLPCAKTCRKLCQALKPPGHAQQLMCPGRCVKHWGSMQAVFQEYCQYGVCKPTPPAPAPPGTADADVSSLLQVGSAQEL